MITSTVKTFDMFPELTVRIEELELHALNEAAKTAAAVASERATGITEFHPIPAGRTAEGYASGIRAKNPIWRVFDKGSLAKRTVPLKRDRRKAEWPVRPGKADRSGYEAHRRTPISGGVDPKDISNPARRAGRKALIAALRR
jgi:hypothetical protein